MKKYFNVLTAGILKENPVFVLMLGLCPTLGVTGSAINGFSMGMAVIAVLACSNGLISLFKKLIPSQVRIPAYIIIIATLVTVVDMVMNAFTPDLYKVLGLFIPLIVVNCIVLGRAESFAAKNGVFESILDGIGSGLGFTLALTFLGAIREILGNGSVFGISLVPEGFQPALIFVLAPGGFITIGIIMACINIYKSKKPKKKEAK
ncbi:MAG: electron transport complex subunit E [Fusobacterium gastrosuis]|uniref:electron transport complex subunit RsxE n=1 Tax=Fusobacterium TaxID=848 RepID=UPI001F4F23A5|nr:MULTISPECIES: electron transport complex subunit E [Fusobacterium]MCI5724419.1 electron transport complex subunit E [Fusobacterium sp.]MCI7222866.1 electron transport complex subunit E [Fusobacterium sp.]MDY4011808.1 electron transport complex subunit E [Fusobacterium gastrosuis]MDY5305509.1 electron transport complex subunit E [Fusobacterium gastrosuis]